MNMLIPMLYMVFSLQQAPAQSAEGMVRLNAQKVDVDHEKQLAKLTGDVRVGWGEFTLTADRVEIRYTEKGIPKTWRAVGQVQVSWRTRVIESRTLFIEQKSDRLIFHGPLVLVDGQQRLNALKATYFSKTHRFVIEHVSGQMNLKDLVSP